jgi:acetyl-CoA carboxylase biotin carboxyl carrier protein
MSVERIKELLSLMDKNDLIELELEEGEFRVKLVKSRPHLAAVAAAPAPAAPHPSAPAAPAAAGAPAAKPAATPRREGLVELTSPIVGTFYRAGAPDSEPFVEVGSHVEADSTLCVIEAMKVMNEVKAETKGTIREILVENGQPVEYGQPIFVIEPVA